MELIGVQSDLLLEKSTQQQNSVKSMVHQRQQNSVMSFGTVRVWIILTHSASLFQIGAAKTEGTSVMGETSFLTRLETRSNMTSPLLSVLWDSPPRKLPIWGIKHRHSWHAQDNVKIIKILHSCQGPGMNAIFWILSKSKIVEGKSCIHGMPMA